MRTYYPRQPRASGLVPNPAPGSLRLIQDFANTLDVEQGSDALESPEALRVWLSSRELLAADAKLRKAEWRKAQKLREGLRALIWSRSLGSAPGPDVIKALNRATAEVSHRVLFSHDGSADFVVGTPGWYGVLMRLVTPILEAMNDGRWVRLKMCRCETCQRVFYDKSKNLGGKWCNPRRCANRINTRIYRRRGPEYSRGR